MVTDNTGKYATRDGELILPGPVAADATVGFIGRLRTPWTARGDCPKQGDSTDGPVCRIEVAPEWRPALQGLERYEWIEVIYWLHRSRRDLLVQAPRGDGVGIGTFALRSPVRPNPLGLSRVRLLGVADGVLEVRGLDCLDGTPLVDLKPDRCSYTPLAGT